MASDPVPPVKPITPTSPHDFIEGVDIPPSKPDATAHEATKETSAKPKAVDCEIDGATVEQTMPFNGADIGDKACGVAAPVKLLGIHDRDHRTSFSSPITVSCEFAKVFAEWLQEDVLPAAEEHLEHSIVKLRNGPGYQCRRRNNQPDGKLSEHALGKAVDLTGFQLGDSTFVSVQEDWGAETREGRFLKSIHASACKRFTTVLGPDADPNHKSHFHLDIGCHGKSCTYLICQ
ncbi:MAG: extensin family protein [Roseibium sp.]|uniref:extensin-like domain-containing protein n=1 Tax=Roseibium sp. TaxID=1936156 RepID=UPI002631A133|nr:extensin family protein [Roseibium sp.]MCV0427379.1 extensin family protein [Roseibium sp.]